MNSHRYESFLLIAASYLVLITGFLCYIVTQEKWILITCILGGLVLAWNSEQANQRAIAEREK